MKIAVESADGANKYIAHSYLTAFSSSGYQTVWYESDGKSPFDFFSEHNDLDLFIGHTWKLNRALVKNLINNKHIKVVLFANHYGSNDSHIDRNRFPIEFASQSEIQFVKQLVDNGVIPVLICQYDNKYINNTHDLWKEKLGLQCYGIKLSADITQYFPVKTSPEYECEVFYCGGRWPFKAQSIDPYLIPLTFPGTDWRVRIVGSGGWNVVNYLGQANENTIRNFYASAFIVPALFEPHVIWGNIPDIPQRIYQAGACGAFQISQNATGLGDIFNDNEVVVVNSPEEFFDRCLYFLNNKDETVSYRQKSINTIMSSHTNLHRAVELFRLLGYPCDKLMEVLDKVYERYMGKT